MINENKGNNYFFLAAFSSVTALIYQLPHPWGASDGSEPIKFFDVVIPPPHFPVSFGGNIGNRTELTSKGLDLYRLPRFQGVVDNLALLWGELQASGWERGRVQQLSHVLYSLDPCTVQPCTVWGSGTETMYSSENWPVKRRYSQSNDLWALPWGSTQGNWNWSNHDQTLMSHGILHGISYFNRTYMWLCALLRLWQGP